MEKERETHIHSRKSKGIFKCYTYTYVKEDMYKEKIKNHFGRRVSSFEWIYQGKCVKFENANYLKCKIDVVCKVLENYDMQ